MGKWILLFFALPAIDLFALVRLGRTIGAQNALLLSLVSAFAGVVLARAVGLRQLRQWRASLAEGRAPSQNVVDALLMLLASAWLVLPGVISDALALLLLVPALRRWLAARATARVLTAIQRGTMQVNVHMPQPVPPTEDVIDSVGETVETNAQSGGSRKLFTP
ncbi:MAG TPA: FxsA family protein [Polyangiales bacterium]|jgi:UPF0716 protein FxsA|nr:FxsA family protein [Polyangiales bacterium]